ncbi:hypothetical protein NC652_032169 [Populus alba x Populus x berolinensis]|nr:hypothetical protein NC652_032169 [Populus alba x Populus x berolinensis]
MSFKVEIVGGKMDEELQSNRSIIIKVLGTLNGRALDVGTISQAKRVGSRQTFLILSTPCKLGGEGVEFTVIIASEYVILTFALAHLIIGCVVDTMETQEGIR